MAERDIDSVELSHLAELISKLGKAGENFVLAGGQAIKLRLPQARATIDYDFILDVKGLRETETMISVVLSQLCYQVDQRARNFQFYKELPGGSRRVLIDFMASDGEKRAKDIRVNIQKGIHARACLGAEIVIRESDAFVLKGMLPLGKDAEVRVRVARTHAILFMKLLAMDDRHRNIRGAARAEDDRDMARTHAADIVRLVRHHVGCEAFPQAFWSQFSGAGELKERVVRILADYYADVFAPGMQLFLEFTDQAGERTGEEELRAILKEIELLSKSRGHSLDS